MHNHLNNVKILLDHIEPYLSFEMGDLRGWFVPELLGDANVHLDALVHQALECLKGLAGAAREPRVIGPLLKRKEILDEGESCESVKQH